MSDEAQSPGLPRPRRPSVVTGARLALRLWRLVVAVWLVPAAAFLPVVLLVHTSLSRALADLPGAGRELPVGDLVLVLRDAWRPLAPGLLTLLAASCLVLWAWGALWHAGVVTWRLWSADRRPRLGEVLGLGLLRWPRYLRLALAWLALGGLLLGGLWVVTAGAVVAAHDAMAEGRMVALLAIALVASFLLVAVGWAATLRGAWELARPAARSALLAWLRGLAGAVADPLRTFGTVALWAGAAKLLTLAPLVLGLAFAALRGGPLGALLVALCSLLAALCEVALLASFAPLLCPAGSADDDAGATAEASVAEPC